MTTAPIKTIAICGGGIAGQLCALALTKHLPDNIELILISDTSVAESDIFYGTLTPASTYDFLLSLGISEPELLLGTKSSFTVGTAFTNWGKDNRNWLQVFHLPLPIHHGVGFHHYLNHITPDASPLEISPYIMSAVAAEKGVFAHPPEGKNIPLAALEYGYHIDPVDAAPFLMRKIKASRVRLIEATIDGPLEANQHLSSVTLNNGQQIEADLFINCTHQTFRENSDHEQSIVGQLKRVNDTSAVLVRNVEETEFGFQATTALQDYTHTLSIADPKDADQFGDNTAVIRLGRAENPWTHNLVSVGLSAGAMAPLTCAPQRLLQLDIQRLIELVPTSQEMKVESREYNRRFRSDFDLSEMFQRALFPESSDTGSAFSRKTANAPICDRLRQKLTQFESRGVLVNFDNEPFLDHDWVLLHLGMGRRPKRYDPLAARLSGAQIEQMLRNMRLSIAQMSAKMPPHRDYMIRFMRFLREKHG